MAGDGAGCQSNGGSDALVKSRQHPDVQHFDVHQVGRLGQLMEVKVVLGSGLDGGRGREIATDLIRRFGIRESDPVPTACADSLQAAGTSRENTSQTGCGDWSRCSDLNRGPDHYE